MLTHGSLFSGVGGFELGARMAGIPTIWNCEYEAHKRITLAQHFPETKQYDDVKTITNVEYVDIISGGFPCQDISVANTKANGIKGQRSGLWGEMFRICGELRPQYIIFENSPMLLVRGFERVLCDLSEIGYVCEWQCLQASQFGYNHKRERVYGIAYPGEKRCKNNIEVFRELSEIFHKQAPRQSPVSITLKRFNSKSSYDDVRMDDGFSVELDKTRIEDMGNAVIPEIAYYLFECIKLHYLNNN